MFNVLKDIRSGELPAKEIPGFIAWLIGKSFWIWFSIVLIGVVIVLAVR